MYLGSLRSIPQLRVLSSPQAVLQKVLERWQEKKVGAVLGAERGAVTVVLAAVRGWKHHSKQHSKRGDGTSIKKQDTQRFMMFVWISDIHQANWCISTIPVELLAHILARGRSNRMVDQRTGLQRELCFQSPGRDGKPPKFQPRSGGVAAYAMVIATPGTVRKCMVSDFEAHCLWAAPDTKKASTAEWQQWKDDNRPCPVALEPLISGQHGRHAFGFLRRT